MDTKAQSGVSVSIIPGKKKNKKKPTGENPWAAQALYHSQREQAWKQCGLVILRALLRGCACPDCEPRARLYSHHVVNISSIAGLSYRAHDAFAIAEWAVSSFHSANLLPTQKLALTKWSALRTSCTIKTEPPTHAVLQDVADVFNELFFCGHLPRSKLRLVLTGATSTSLATTWPSPTQDHPETIAINIMSHCLWARPIKVLQVLLHEMSHCYLGRYTCYPWSLTRLACATGSCGASYQTNLREGGHGRAWQYLTRAIEDCMPRYLNLPGNLGRDLGIANKITCGSHLPCGKEVDRIYKCDYGHQEFWSHVRRSRDDNFAEHTVLLVGKRIKTQCGRRASDSAYELVNNRRPLGGSFE